MTRAESARRFLLTAGMGALVLLPAVQLNSAYRFALLPQVLLLLVAALLLCLSASLHPRPNGRPDFILPLSGLLLLSLIGTAGAVNPVASLLPIVTHLGYILALLALTACASADTLAALARVMALVGSALCGLGILEYTGFGSLFHSAAPPSASFGHRNLAGAHVAALLPMTLWLWRRAERTSARAGWDLALGLQVAFLIATRSRAGAAAGLVGFAAWALLTRFRSLRRPVRAPLGLRWASIAAGLGLVALTALKPPDAAGLAGEPVWGGKREMGELIRSSFEAGGDKGRLQLWQRTLEIIQDQPIMGVGAGNWRIAYPAYAEGELIDSRVMPHRPHNELLRVASETGLPGAALTLLTVLLLLKSGWRHAGASCCAAAWTASITAFCVSAAFGFPLEFPAASTPFLVSAAGLGAVAHQGLRRQSIFVPAAVVLLLGIGIAGAHVRFDQQALKQRVSAGRETWREVVAAGEAALDVGPLDEEVFLLTGRGYLGLNTPGPALERFQDGLRYHPNHFGLWVGVGEARRRMGGEAEALKAFRKAVDLNPRSGEALNNIGTIYAAAGRLDSSVIYLEQASRFGAYRADVFSNLGIVYRKLGRLEDALKAARKSVELAPGRIQSQHALGMVLLESGEFEAAGQAFRRCLNLNPRFTIARFHLATALLGDGRKLDAAASFQAFLGEWRGPHIPEVDAAREALGKLKAGETSRTAGG